ncbi:MAG TPA: hypothetical protein VHE55_00305 [Fimbriimonadaceae bacterium]|nr:hypothetical protein [Fimbriimonadaceae bacterium]
MEPFRLTTYEPIEADRKLAAVGLPVFVLLVWGLLAFLFVSSQDLPVRIACAGLALLAAGGAVLMAIIGVTHEEIVIEGGELRILTTRMRKVAERSYRLTPGSIASVEPVTMVKTGKEITAVVLQTDSGPCWVSAGATEADKQHVAERINVYLSRS